MDLGVPVGHDIDDVDVHGRSCDDDHDVEHDRNYCDDDGSDDDVVNDVYVYNNGDCYGHINGDAGSELANDDDDDDAFCKDACAFDDDYNYC